MALTHTHTHAFRAREISLWAAKLMMLLAVERSLDVSTRTSPLLDPSVRNFVVFVCRGIWRILECSGGALCGSIHLI